MIAVNFSDHDYPPVCFEEGNEFNTSNTDERSPGLSMPMACRLLSRGNREAFIMTAVTPLLSTESIAHVICNRNRLTEIKYDSEKR